MNKSAKPIDIHVGSRVRLRRMILKISQEKLAEYLGLTFQQVQKYEKGHNRISASRLYHIAQILGVPVQFFYDDMPAYESDVPVSPNVAIGLREGETEFVMDFVNSPEGLQLNQAYNQIKNPDTRKRILDLVKTLADADIGQPAKSA